MNAVLNGAGNAPQSFPTPPVSVLSGNQSTKILRFQTNVPVQVAYRSGREVQGNYGPQWMYTLSDGRIMYVEPVVAQQINGLEIKPGELFSICKCEVRELGEGRPVIRWHVKQDRDVLQGPSASSGASLASATGQNLGVPVKMPMDRAVVAAVRMVQAAMAETGEQWADGPRQDLVSTVLIQMAREGWIAAPGKVA